VRLTQTVGGTLLTTDYNLKKVAALQGVKVLNVNELAERCGPSMLPATALISRSPAKEKSQVKG
jgi:uncharacterized protein YacL